MWNISTHSSADVYLQNCLQQKNGLCWSGKLQHFWTVTELADPSQLSASLIFLSSDKVKYYSQQKSVNKQLILKLAIYAFLYSANTAHLKNSLLWSLSIPISTGSYKKITVEIYSRFISWVKLDHLSLKMVSSWQSLSLNQSTWAAVSTSTHTDF